MSPGPSLEASQVTAARLEVSGGVCVFQKEVLGQDLFLRGPQMALLIVVSLSLRFFSSLGFAVGPLGSEFQPFHHLASIYPVSLIF